MSSFYHQNQYSPSRTQYGATFDTRVLPEAYFSTVGGPYPPTMGLYPNQHLDTRPSTFPWNNSYPAFLPTQHWATHPYGYSLMSGGHSDNSTSLMRPTAWAEVHDRIDYSFHMGNEVSMSSAPGIGHYSTPVQPSWSQTSWMSPSSELSMWPLDDNHAVLQLFSVSCGATHLCECLGYEQCCQHPRHLTWPQDRPWQSQLLKQREHRQIHGEVRHLISNPRSRWSSSGKGTMSASSLHQGKDAENLNDCRLCKVKIYSKGL